MGAHEPAQVWVVPSHWRHTWKLAGNPLEECNPEQKAKLHELQRLLHSEGAWSKEYHDFYSLRRFLKAREWDVPKAKAMWQEMLAFRANNHVDTILHDFVFTEREHVLAAYPHGLHKVDREGRPVLVYKFGGLDLDALEKITTNQRLTQFHVQEYERIMRCVLPACSLLAGRHIEKIVTLIDVAGIRMRDIGRVLELLSTYIKVDSNNYPETLAAMIIVNAPMWFSGSFSLIKRMLSAETQKKVQILGSNYQQTLHSIIAPENLLPDFGGTSTGQLASGAGPWIAVLEQLQQAEMSSTHAPTDQVPSPPTTTTTTTTTTTQKTVSKAPAGLPGQVVPVMDVKQRDDDAHVTAQSRRAVSGSGNHLSPVALVHVENHMVLHPPEPAALPGATADSQLQPQPHQSPVVHAGQKHLRQGEEQQGQQHMRQAVHEMAVDMQGVELHKLHQSLHPPPATATQNGKGPPQQCPIPSQQPQPQQQGTQKHGQPHAVGGSQQQQQQQQLHLATITESDAAFDISTKNAQGVQGGRPGMPGAAADMLGPSNTASASRPEAPTSTLDSFYSIPDSTASWMSGDMGPIMNSGPLQAIITQQQQRRASQRVNDLGPVSSASGEAAGALPQPAMAQSPHPLTEARLRSHYSLDGSQAMYKSQETLDTVSIVSFESCRSGESFTGSASMQPGWSQVPGGSPASGGSRPLQGKGSFRSSSSRRDKDGKRLPKWLGGGGPRGSVELEAAPAPGLPPRDWQWDEADGLRQRTAPPATGPYAVLPSFTAWGPNAPLLYTAAPGPDGPVYVPAGIPLPSTGGTPMAGMLPPGYLTSLPNPLLSSAGVPGMSDASHARAAIQLNEYMRMWFQSAAEAFAGRSPMSAPSRQQLLDPSEGSLIGNVAPGKRNGLLVGQGSVDVDAEGVAMASGGPAVPHGAAGLRARTRAEMILGAVRHKRAHSGGAHAPLRIGSLSDEALVSPVAAHQAVDMTDVNVRSPTVAGGPSNKKPAVSYEVYVDSEDEDGAGLLHRGARQVLPRYGAVRMVVRRVFCCGSCL